MLVLQKEDKLLYPDDHLIWCSNVDSGPRKDGPDISRFQTVVQKVLCHVDDNITYFKKIC